MCFSSHVCSVVFPQEKKKIGGQTLSNGGTKLHSASNMLSSLNPCYFLRPELNWDIISPNCKLTSLHLVESFKVKQSGCSHNGSAFFLPLVRLAWRNVQCTLESLGTHGNTTYWTPPTTPTTVVHSSYLERHDHLKCLSWIRSSYIAHIIEKGCSLTPKCLWRRACPQAKLKV